MLRSAPLAAIVVLALAGPAWADGLEGTYRTEGRHSRRGPFTGEVTIARDGSAYAVTVHYRFAAGGTLTATGPGTVAGDQLDVAFTLSRGITDALDGEDGPLGDAWGTYRIAGDSLRGGWTLERAGADASVTETLTRAASAPAPAPSDGVRRVDLVLVRTGGALVPEAEEETAGIVAALNVDDDDNDGGQGGDGQVRVVSDRADRDATTGEDDLVEVRLAFPAAAPAGSFVRVAAGEGLRVWRGRDRTGPVGRDTRVPPRAVSLFVEGVRASQPGQGEPLALELVADGGAVLGSDRGVVHVTRPAFLLVGHGGTGDYSLQSTLRSRALDRRSDPTIVAGRDASGQAAYWSVHIWRTERLAKIALSTEGAVIAYDGHSNFGMGFAFATGFRRMRDFMNIANPQVPVNWPYLREHQEHPALLFDMREYGDDTSTAERYDPVRIEQTFEGTLGSYSAGRFPVAGGDGERCHLILSTNKTYAGFGPRRRWEDRHYGEGEGARIVIRAGSRDMPAKRWAALFLNSCYSGQYYSDSFGGQGTLFFTHESASSSRTSAIFLLGFVDGRTNDAILTELNQAENVNDYVVFGE